MKEFDAFALPADSGMGTWPPGAPGSEHGGGLEHLEVSPEFSIHFPVATSELLGELSSALRTAGTHLAARPASEVVDVLGRVGERFLDDGDDLRREALDLLPASAGLSLQMAVAVLDGMAADWTRERLSALMKAEFAQPEALDRIVVSDGPENPRSLMAFGPRLCVQVVAGSVPGVGVNALLRSLLVKGPTLIKPGLGDVVLPVLFANALRREDPAIADAVGLLYWPGGSTTVERAAMADADLVVAYGSDETVASLRNAAPATTRVVAYHHRVGVAVVGRAALEGTAPGPAAPGAVAAEGPGRAAKETARAIAMFEHRGCVCPHVVYVEEGGATSPVVFAEEVATALSELETVLPSVNLDATEAAGLQQARGTAELHAASGAVRLAHGGPWGSWTVLYEEDPVPVPTLVGRSVRIRPIRDASGLPEVLEPIGVHLQTVGYSGLGDRPADLASGLGRIGVSRIVPLRDVSYPPPWWLHDGRGPLTQLVRWVELEQE